MKTKPYVVLVGMDFSELADRALEQAFELATRRERSEVHVLCVIPSAGLGAQHALTGYSLTAEAGVRDGAFESLRAHVQAELDAFVARAAAPGTVRVPEQVVSHVRLDTPALGIVELAGSLSADLIVVGTHGQRRSNPLLDGLRGRKHRTLRRVSGIGHSCTETAERAAQHRSAAVDVAKHSALLRFASPIHAAVRRKCRQRGAKAARAMFLARNARCRG